jgi:DNA-binding response OmpR family regulator
MTQGKPLLVVEDEDSDALLLKLALEQAHIGNRLIRLRDGQELIDYLNANGAVTEPEFCLPGLMLLDLKMPRVDGFSVLAWRAARRDLQDIPTVVFSASGCEADRQKALALGATDYLTKPSQFKVLVGIIEALYQRFLNGTSQATEHGHGKIERCSKEPG